MQQKTGVLLVNLGTPASPAPKDVYRYLIEFLTDGRVINEPWWKRQLLVRGLIVPFRYRQSAASYAAIWTDKGSPLLFHSREAERLLQNRLGDDYIVALAMRYQEPSLKKELERLLDSGISHLIVVPLFPQYASATTGSVHQRVMELLSKRIVIPKVTLIDSYPDHPKMIDAFDAVSKKYNWRSYDHVLISFHGLPERQLISNSPFCYSAQCRRTAAAIVQKLEIPESKYTVCYQSRLGKQPWIQPYTSDSIKQCADAGNKRVLVFCPSFVSDCLETIHEIGVEYAEEFIGYGGESLDLVEGLNSHPVWIEALEEIVKKKSVKR